ncbi:unnamed protein product [Durusdinium trenchii]|uniref:DUF1294 domain-containing protein n=1 Tax=Durusdinium trenchii TaxID=1381693 RepID=A0ABP0H5J0_9DINO
MPEHTGVLRHFGLKSPNTSHVLNCTTSISLNSSFRSRFRAMNPGNISSWLSRWRQYGIIGILGSLLMVNVATVALFWYDKHQAKTGGWRVPERTLQGTAALGGWPAGYVAMEMFHHKTKKQSFRVGYHAATAANVGLASYGLSALGQTQPARAHGRRKRR